MNVTPKSHTKALVLSFLALLPLLAACEPSEDMRNYLDGCKTDLECSNMRRQNYCKANPGTCSEEIWQKEYDEKKRKEEDEAKKRKQEEDNSSAEDAIDRTNKDANDLLDIGGSGGSIKDKDQYQHKPTELTPTQIDTYTNPVPTPAPVPDYGGSGYGGSGY